MKKLFFTVIFCLIASFAFSQDYSTTSLKSGLKRVYNFDDSGTNHYARLMSIYAQASVNGGVIECVPKGSYSFTNAITNIDSSKVRFKGNLATWYFTNAAVTNAPVIKVWSSQEHQNNVFPLEGLTIVGKTNQNQIGIQFGDGTTNNWGSGLGVKECNIYNFGTNFTWSHNSWNNRIQNSKVHDGILLYYFPSGLTNSGENLQIINTTSYNCTNVANIDAANMYFHGGSIDYFRGYIYSGSDGHFNHVHIETSYDDDYLFKIAWADPKAQITVNNSEIVFQGARTKEIGTSIAGSTGVTGRGNTIYTNAAYSPAAYFVGARDFGYNGDYSETIGIPITYILAGNVSTTNTNLTTITGLSASLKPSCKYVFEACMQATAGADTNGSRYGLNFSSTGLTFQGDIMGNGGAGGGTVNAQSMSTLDSASLSYQTTSSAFGTIRMMGYINNGTNAGTFNIQHKKNTSGTNTVYTPSYMRVWRVSP